MRQTLQLTVQQLIVVNTTSRGMGAFDGAGVALEW